MVTIQAKINSQIFAKQMSWSGASLFKYFLKKGSSKKHKTKFFNPSESAKNHLVVSWSRDLHFRGLHKYVSRIKKFSFFSTDTKFGDFIVHWSIAALKCKENLSTNFGLIAIFEKVAVEITKKAQHCVLPWFTCFRVSRNHASRLALSRLLNVWGSCTKWMSDKNFSETSRK